MHENIWRILPRPLQAVCACAGVLYGHAAWAQEQEPVRGGDVPRVEVSVPTEEGKRDFEGAIGPMLIYRPEYQGGAQSTLAATPGVFLRWGRFTITNASGFVTRRDGDVMRGLAADLVHSERWRANLALRLDHGRATKDSSALSGLDDVRRTVRGRLQLSHTLDDGWSASAAASVDLLGRGGGTVVDLGVGRSFPLAPRASWNLGLNASAADRRYTQSYFGVSAAQAADTGYAPYAPGSGWRDLSVSLGARSEFGERWIGYVGVSQAWLMGPARRSPLSQQPSSWAVTGGLAWRF
ncbi:MAG: MipA/OmpV family protein [Burkholderiaceae bacterium]|nr:MipA/OmpV family protein [Burkholderiaceae bacterium]